MVRRSALLLSVALCRQAASLALKEIDDGSNVDAASALQHDTHDTDEESGQKLISFRLACSSNSTVGVWVILYQTSVSLAPLGGFLYSQLADQMAGLMQPEVLGMGTHFGGFSSKHHLAIQRLRAMDNNDLVILSDYADVVLNPGRALPGSAFCSFVDEYARLMDGQNPDAIVISAEAQCCVGALSYVQPGDYIGHDGMRRLRACNSGASGCQGLGEDKTWQSFMQDTAAKRGFNGTSYPYLNAGLMAGRAGAMAKMLSDIQLEAEEDDQAVMTDMLYRFPDRFVLDYGQRLFGNARWPMGQAGCVFRLNESTGFFEQTETGSHPLFLHTSGKFYSCLRTLALEVGWNASRQNSGAASGGVSGVAPLVSLLAAASSLLFP